MKRSRPVAQMSAKRKDGAADRAVVREAVLARDGGRCRQEGHGCFGRPTLHHLRKASQGGRYEPENLVVLCVAANDAVEDDPDAAHALGLVRRAGDTIEEVWARLFEAGLSSTPEPGSPPDHRTKEQT